MNHVPNQTCTSRPLKPVVESYLPVSDKKLFDNINIEKANLEFSETPECAALHNDSPLPVNAGVAGSEWPYPGPEAEGQHLHRY